eukprot:scaffold15973_cov120-Cylindrotheca_fusiformis.AAC.2
MDLKCQTRDGRVPYNTNTCHARVVFNAQRREKHVTEKLTNNMELLQQPPFTSSCGGSLRLRGRRDGLTSAAVRRSNANFQGQVKVEEVKPTI